MGSFLRRQLQAPLARASGIAGIGTVATEAYRQLFPGKPVFNIPYFCDLAPYRAARARARHDGSHVDVLFSGQMIARKGVDLLIDAFARVAPHHPSLRLLLLGGGPERERFEAQVLEPLKDRILFLGHREPADLPDVFAAADIFCLPSRHDGWGVVINEALGAGLPLIVSDAVGAGHDLVTDGENGIVTPAGNADALARALDTLAGDIALRKRMAEAATETAERWDVDAGVRRWWDAVHRLIDTAATA
jgi:glycosyltransferase involved in cell wall biosynthesis